MIDIIFRVLKFIITILTTIKNSIALIKDKYVIA